MRITITANGSRGDVQPYVALGVGLGAAGHKVAVSAPGAFEELVRKHGLGFHPTRVDVREFMQSLMGAGTNFPRMMYRVRQLMKPRMKEMFEDYIEACRGADVVLYGANSYPGRRVARWIGIPTVATALQPMFHSTRLYPSSVADTVLPLPFELREGMMRAAYNRASYAATRQVFWQMMRRSVNEASREILGVGREPLLGPYRRVALSGEPWLNAWSPEIVPDSPEWGANVHTTGYWFLDTPAGWRPPEILRDFLESGPAPVSVGFGSMTSEDPERLTEAVLGALRSCGQRGILLSGWGGISNSDLPDEVIKVEEAPHGWLFGRACAVLHHGGAGTTAASLRSGVPTITVPFFADQRFWGSRIAALGAGPPPIPSRSATSATLGEAIRLATTNPKISRAAGSLGERIRAEGGVRQAVRIIEDYLAGRVRMCAGSSTGRFSEREG